MANPAMPVFGWATAAPTDTTIYNEAGSYLRNSAPTAGSASGWTCTVAGKPGTWVPVGPVGPSGMSTITAAGTLTAGSKSYNVTGAGNQTMFSAASLGTEGEINVIANGVAVTLVAAANQTLVGTVAITSGTAVKLVSNGVNTFYRVN